MFVLSLIASSLLSELLAIVTHGFWRRLLAAGGVLLHFVVVGTLLATGEFLPGSLLLFIGMFRFINALRLARPQMHEKALRKRSLRTWLFLLPLTLLGLVDWQFSLDATMLGLTIASFLASLALLLSVVISYRKYRMTDNSEFAKKPTVSLCIPARNETQDLPGCIEAALASSYSKLEIIVLDDCSHDKTPEIIKHYAHQGVRFVRGQEPGDKWLAKNAAYDKLLDEATGETVLFIGVDVRLGKQTITTLVEQLGDNSMISVLPRRSLDSESSFFIQPLRYWWELGLWRFRGSHPPVLSTCWMARAEFLRRNGGFEAYRRSIKPEAQIARQARNKKAYQFVIANDELGITSQKSPQDQLDTALRVRYPQLRRRPEAVLVLIVILSVLGIVPIVTLIYSLSSAYLLSSLLSGVSIVFLAFANMVLSRLALRKLWGLALFTAPALSVIDGYIAIRSMIAYETGVVIWKDRNICLPMLQVEKSLPKY